MYEKTRETHFTEIEARQYIGRYVMLNSRETRKIVDVFCEGPDAYSLLTSDNYNVAKSSNNGLYVIS